MKVHLLRDPDYSLPEYHELTEFLQSFDGPIKFLRCDELENGTLKEMEEVEEDLFYKQEMCFVKERSIAYPPQKRYVATWRDLFKVCSKYRRKHSIPNDEFVILLTPVANKNNWFSASDPNARNNGFVHVGEWEYYVQCPATFPVAYLVASLLLQSRMFNSIQHLKDSVHLDNFGCFNDFCENKKEIILKLRTADICPTCMQLLEGKVNTLEIVQVLDIFEGVRKRILFVQQFMRNKQPSKMQLRPGGKIILTDYGNVVVKLNPLETTLYTLFLRHSEGIPLSCLVDHRDELRDIYACLSHSGMMAEVNNRVQGLVDVNSNSASEKISKIKQRFTKAIGAELAEHYIIKGGDGCAKGISLQRSLVE